MFQLALALTMVDLSVRGVKLPRFGFPCADCMIAGVLAYISGSLQDMCHLSPYRDISVSSFPRTGSLRPRYRPHGSWTHLRGLAPAKEPGVSAQDSVRALGSLSMLERPQGTEARRKLRTLSHRCQMTQQMRHATPDPVRNQVCHVEPRIAIPIPAQCPGSCGTESRTQRRTLSSIGRIPQRFPHAPPYLEGTCRTVSNPCRVQQWIPHAIVGNNRGPVGNASIPYDLDSNVRPAD